jgi:hypothetical protein
VTRKFDDHADGKMPIWIEWRSARRGRSATDGDVSRRVRFLFVKATLAQPTIYVTKTISSLVLNLLRMHMSGHADWLLHSSILRSSNQLLATSAGSKIHAATYVSASPPPVSLVRQILRHRV